MINVQEYRKFRSQTFGLGQDVAHDLTKIVRVPALFIANSQVVKELRQGKLIDLTTKAGAPIDIYEELNNALGKDKMTKKQLVSLKDGRKPYATGLIRALYRGQRSPVIVDWAATNYLSVAVGLGLVDYGYSEDVYTVTNLGQEAVSLLDQNQKDSLSKFMLERLYEYPYAAWMIRLMNSDREKKFSKFDLGANFGFIDEPGFISLPEDLYVDAMLDAKADNDKKELSKIRSNYESTADKYMRWLAGVLLEYKLIKKSSKIYHRTINDKMVEIKVPAYSLTLNGVRALNKVNGGSRFKRSTKRVMWEYLAPKAENAQKKKTSRALMLNFLVENSNGLDTDQLANKINAVEPSIAAIPEQVRDDALGLNRIGIEVDIKRNHLTLKESLYDFVIPVTKNYTFKATEADKIKEKLLPALHNLDHTYLQAVDIAYKDKTTNQENAQLEILSTNLFIKEMEFKGMHLGGVNKPDGFAYDNNDGWIIDSKAYHNGFPLTVSHSDAMGRYIRQYRDRNDNSTWWKKLPTDIPHTQFIYVSSFFIGNYEKQLEDFETRNNMKGSLMEIPQLLLLAERYKAGKLSHDEFKSYALANKHDFTKYYSELTAN